MPSSVLNIPVLIAVALIGVVCLVVACLKHRHRPQALPKEADWTPFNEISMAFVLTNAGLFFAVHCLRGLIIVGIAVALPALAAIGSHLRYRQTLATYQLGDDDRPPLLRQHLWLACGLFLTFVAELLTILVVLTY